MGCFSPDQPAPLNYGQLTSNALRTQVGLEPMLLASQAQFQPAQTNLQLQNMNQLLFGSPEQSLDVQTYRPAVNQTGTSLSYGGVPKGFLGQIEKPQLPTFQNGRWVYPNAKNGTNGTNGAQGMMPMGATGPGFAPGSLNLRSNTNGDAGVLGITGSTAGDGALLGGVLGGPMGALAGGALGAVANAFGFGDEPQTVRVAGPQYGTQRTTLPGQQGLIGMANQANTATRAATLGDIAGLGPDTVNALLAANPQMAGLINSLNQQAQAGLDAGTSLTPEETRLMQQASRASAAARGMDGSNASAANEVLQQYILGQQLQRQRQAFASGVVGQDQSVLQNPMLALMTQQNGVMGGAQGMMGGPMFNPESPYAGNLAAANQQMNALFASPSTMSKINSVVGTVGNVFGALGKVAGGVAGL